METEEREILEVTGKGTEGFMCKQKYKTVKTQSIFLLYREIIILIWDSILLSITLNINY